jgi:predicted MFS family arabinose efflux permease
MLVVLHFHQLGYDPLSIALLFLFYEFFGVVTNLLGGWLGAQWGLNRTMHLGLLLQILALAMLLAPAAWMTVPWVMAAQALSGIAKDLNKMSAKSAIKLLVPEGDSSRLFKWVALLTGSKNTLKGVGFFLGGLLLSLFGFHGALWAMIVLLVLAWIVSLALLKGDLGRARNKPKFRDLLSKSRAVNVLSAARFFLFAARDVWFVVALPVYLSALGWSFESVGAFLALWVVGYGVVQAQAPRWLNLETSRMASGRQLALWGWALTLSPAILALALNQTWPTAWVLIFGLALFGVLFAINSALHSYLIVAFAKTDGVSLDVGFYYMANAAGRLVGTVLSGWLYQTQGLEACLWTSAAMLAVAAATALRLPDRENRSPQSSVVR